MSEKKRTLLLRLATFPNVCMLLAAAVGIGIFAAGFLTGALNLEASGHTSLHLVLLLGNIPGILTEAILYGPGRST